MRRRKFTAPAQLSLSLLPQPSVPQIEADSPTLLQAIANLLLEALGQAAEADRPGGADEPEDHA